MSDEKASSYDPWVDAEEAPQQLRDAYAQAMKFLGMGNRWFDVKVANTDDPEWDGTHMATQSSDGNDALFLVTQWHRDLQMRQKGLFSAATIVHEVLEMYLWPLMGAIRTLPPESGKPIHKIAHHLLDKLAWDLMPHVYPNLDPEKDPTQGDGE